MNEDLQKQLYDKYPKIFQDKDKSMMQTCMCWGIETGDGWFRILNALCKHLQWDTDKNGYPQVVAEQVKEKFGTLRFYYRLEETEESKKRNQQGADDRIQGAIDFAETMTEITCETCGAPGEISKGPWISVQCEACREAARK